MKNSLIYLAQSQMELQIGSNIERMHLPARVSLFILLILTVSIGINIILLYHLYQSHIVVSVVDGDSINLKDGRRIRLLGIDAPERNRCFHEESKAKLTELTLNKHVWLTDIVTDDFGRQLALVWMNNNLVQKELIGGGFVKTTGSIPHTIDLTPQTNYAKEERLGIYSSLCRPQSASDNCTIKGNTRAGTHIYHLPTCKNYKQTEIDLSYGDQWFCTEQEARESGFTKASGC